MGPHSYGARLDICGSLSHPARVPEAQAGSGSATLWTSEGIEGGTGSFNQLTRVEHHPLVQGPLGLVEASAQPRPL